MPAASPGSLAAFAAQKVILYPLQNLYNAAAPAWRPTIADPGAFLAQADSAIEAALAVRGLGSQWVYPKALQRSARRNPTYLVDPYTVRVGPALIASQRKKDEPIPEPAAGILRAHAGVSDARYVVVPLELRTESLETGGRLAVRLAVVDARGARMVWIGETMTELRSAFALTMVEDLATRIADLVVPR